MRGASCWRALILKGCYMGINIDFYKCTDDKRVINKTLGTAKTLSDCTLNDESSIINPSFIIDTDSTIYDYNYVYIAYFGRYYYITDIIVLNGEQMKINCAVDVLKSHASEILNCTVNSRRNENNYDMYLPDDRPIESRYIRYSKEFGTSFKDFTPSYILITVGNGDLPISPI